MPEVFGLIARKRSHIPPHQNDVVHRVEKKECEKRHCGMPSDECGYLAECHSGHADLGSHPVLEIMQSGPAGRERGETMVIRNRGDADSQTPGPIIGWAR